MEFRDHRQHDPNTLNLLHAALQAERLPMRQAMVLADKLVTHGHPDALRVIEQLKEVRHSDVAALTRRLEQCYFQLRQCFRLEDIDQKFLQLTYRQNGFVFFRNQQPSRKLLVIFSTMFNNFYFSNLALLQLLRGLGCHILLLKDATCANYHLGTTGFARDMPGIAARIRALKTDLDAQQIYLSGFSSGGYAALLTSLLLPASGYLGFSHATDLSVNSALPQSSYFTKEVRAHLNPRWLLDLRLPLERSDTLVPRTIYYGKLSAKDTAHARHLEGAPGIETICLPDAGHNSIQHLMATGELVSLFRQLVADQ